MGSACFFIDIQDDSIELNRSFRHFETYRHGCTEFFDYQIPFDSYDALVWTGHADITDESCTAWEQSLICRLNMSMSTYNSTDPAVCIPGQRTFFRSGFSMDINYNCFNLLLQQLQFPVQC